MQLKRYTVNILDANGKVVAEDAQGYVGLKHGDEYQIEVVNGYGVRACAYTSIDGKDVGNFIVGGDSSIRIERPVSIARKFTFLAAGSQEAKAANLDHVSDDKLGLVTIRVVPEQRIGHANHWPKGGNLRSMDFGPQTRGMSAGGTGLGRESGQSFHTVSFVPDEANGVTFNLRLVVKQAEPAIVPLPDGKQPTATPVPPPVARP